MHSLEAELEDAAERMDPGHVAHTALDVVHAMPEDVLHAAVKQGKTLYKLTPFLLARLRATIISIFVANPQAWLQAIGRSPGAAASQLAVNAGQALGLQSRTTRVTHPRGMSPTQVQQYRGRQRQRGYVPGRQRGRRQREMELEFELGLAAHALTAESESPQTNWVYFHVWSYTPNGWQYKGEGPWQMTKDQANQMAYTLQLRYKQQGASQVSVQCVAYLPVSQRWVPCQNWY